MTRDQHFYELHGERVRTRFGGDRRRLGGRAVFAHTTHAVEGSVLFCTSCRF